MVQNTQHRSKEDFESWARVRERSPKEFHQDTDRGLVMRGPETPYELSRVYTAHSLSQIISNAGIAFMGKRGLVDLAGNVLDEMGIQSDLPPENYAKEAISDTGLGRIYEMAEKQFEGIFEDAEGENSYIWEKLEGRDFFHEEALHSDDIESYLEDVTDY